MHANLVSTVRWIDASDDGIACLELHFLRQCDERSTDPDFTVDAVVPSSWTEQMYLRTMDTTIKDSMESIFY